MAVCNEFKFVNEVNHGNHQVQHAHSHYISLRLSLYECKELPNYSHWKRPRLTHSDRESELGRSFNKLCPMDAIVAYLKIRENKVGPFFQLHDGTFLSIAASYQGATGLASHR